MKKFSKGILIFLCICLALFGIGAGVLSVLVMTDVMTDFDPDKLGSFSETTWVLDRNDALVSGVYKTENRTTVSIEEIPELVRNVFISAEDVRFYKHHGIDPVRIFGALFANLKSGSLSQGASTITQQLVKNTHLTNEKTFSRKFQEAILALKVERSYTKEQILEMYLNYVYFGNGAYGIRTASERYFGKDVDELTLTEACALAATLKAPSNYAPHIQPENNQKRREQILNTMVEQGYISADQAAAAKEEKLVLVQNTAPVSKYNWYMDAVLEEAETLLSVKSEELMEMGLRIYTSMDCSIQAACDEVYQNSSLFPADSADGTPCQSALVLMDSSTGDVLAMEGGREYTTRKGFNRALSGRRQPGSILKPLAVYAPALERRIVTPATVFLDQETDFNGYSPKNYGGKYYGAVTLRTAAAKSLNVAPVQLLYEMGGTTGYESLLRFHIKADATDTGLSLGVGSMKNGVTPMEMAAAYASLSSGGTYHSPTLIRRIEDRDGKVLYQAPDAGEQILEPSVAFVLNNMLQSAASWGTAKTLSGLEVPIAGKTGTVDYDSQHNRDAWAAAYTPQLSAVCWMGFDTTDSTHSLPSSVTGGSQPTTLLYEVLSKLKVQPVEFTQPDGVIWAALDAQSMQDVGTLYLAGPYTTKEDTVYEVFVAGTEPSLISNIRVVPQTPADVSVSAGQNGYPLVEFTAQEEGVVYHLFRSYRGSAHEIAQITGITGSTSAYLDTTAQRLFSYEYYLVPEYPNTGVFGEASQSIGYTVPLLPFSIAWE